MSLNEHISDQLDEQAHESPRTFYTLLIEGLTMDDIHHTAKVCTQHDLDMPKEWLAEVERIKRGRDE